MRTTHIVDTYDIYTTLGPPTNSLWRSPTEYRCNKVSRKTLLVLLQWHYLFTVCPPLTTTTHHSTKWHCLHYYYNRLDCPQRCLHGSNADRIVKRREGAPIISISFCCLSSLHFQPKECIRSNNIRVIGGSVFMLYVFIDSEKRKSMFIWLFFMSAEPLGIFLSEICPRYRSNFAKLEVNFDF